MQLKDANPKTNTKMKQRRINVLTVLNFGITVNYAHIYFPDIAGNTQYIIFGSSFRNIVAPQ